ncbi:pyrroline-5-carboxylate reductase [Alicyclobacillus acidiphilus]|uniref:pyrroline-5-carboxylate reductase n=1 Tax=Alicyclobacillus acidiphilus TaxID=182455 RepID=UPI00082BDA8E|nr:pyrroline-5-carboxylate reductase [Alicyclobacillus acidiphilus]
MERIFILGAGAMAEAFIKGVVSQHLIEPQRIRVLNRQRPERLRALNDLYGVTPAESVREARDADVIVLAVKPYDVKEACQSLTPYLDGQTIISFAAGIPIRFMQEATGGRAQIVRTMPNVPVAVLEGAIALSAAPDVDGDRIDQAKTLLSKLGTVVELEESMMDAATAFSGSGPGFVSFFLEAMELAAVDLGFSAEMARSLLIQTVVGTAKVLEEWGLSPTELRERVTSPNGTTHAGLTILSERNVQQAIADALRQAQLRSVEMGTEYTEPSEA